jgi:hypothetical protein
MCEAGLLVKFSTLVLNEMVCIGTVTYFEMDVEKSIVVYFKKLCR